MFIISLLFINLLLASADDALQNGYCDITQNSCDYDDTALKDKGLLFYDVNPPEGFNLRRDVYMRFAIMLVEAQKLGKLSTWSLVLPPWHNIYHWRSESPRDAAKPWSLFFDIDALKSYAPVIEMREVLAKTGYNALKLDAIYVLQNFEDAFENGVFEDKWKVVGPCKYEGKFWGYRNITAKEVTCIQFQGSISQLLKVLTLHPTYKKVMIHHGEIPLHDLYGTKAYWECRKSMKYNHDLIIVADIYIFKKLNCFTLKCSNYLAAHWRRQDFLYSNRATSVKGTAKQIHDTIKNKSLAISDVFVATDANLVELQQLDSELKSLGLKAHFYLPNPDKYTDGQIAIIEQIICSRAAYFIGTHESTFTYRIQEEREILGLDSDTTFNRFCPDFGECERPSRWTIVN